MNPALDSYYSRNEVSNSDLGWLSNQLNPKPMPDPTNAFKFGSLIDAMLTEQYRVNYFKRTCDDDQFTPEEFGTAENMKRAFMADDIARTLISGADTQKVMIERKDLNFEGIDFSIRMRCKWDIWRNDLGFGGDIKSTTATTQAQFETAIKYFNYDRQRAFYMNMAGSEKDVLIGISKKNFKVFKVYINRNSELYKEGYHKYITLSFKWWRLFGETK